MDKEEKMDKLYTDIWFWLEDKSETTKDQVMKMLGYHKLPEGEPPLLSDEELKEIYYIKDDDFGNRKIVPPEVENMFVRLLKAAAQAQRESDKKHFKS